MINNRQKIRRAIEDALASGLSRGEVMVLMLGYADGLTDAETAQVIVIDVAEVPALRQRAKGFVDLVVTHRLKAAGNRPEAGRAGSTAGGRGNPPPPGDRRGKECGETGG